MLFVEKLDRVNISGRPIVVGISGIANFWGDKIKRHALTC